MGDAIAMLPVNANAGQTEDELRLLRSISQPAVSPAAVPDPAAQLSGKSVSSEIKNLIIVAVLFALFSSEPFGNFINRIVPSAEDKWYYQLGIRTVLFAALYFLLVNMSYIKA